MSRSQKMEPINYNGNLQMYEELLAFLLHDAKASRGVAQPTQQQHGGAAGCASDGAPHVTVSHGSSKFQGGAARR